MSVSASKPLRFKGDDRKVVLVGVMPNGDIVATSFYSHGKPWANPSLFDPKTGVERQFGSLTIENAPVVSSGFHPIAERRNGVFGRGLTMLSSVWDDYPSCVGAIEIIYEDDRPIDAKFHARP